MMLPPGFQNKQKNNSSKLPFYLAHKPSNYPTSNTNLHEPPIKKSPKFF